MRTIKFRGKCAKDSKYAGEWVEGGLLQCEKSKDVLIVYSITDTCSCTYHVDPATVGQFTGLHDKNGKEIYEGDIIRSTRNGFGGVVMWHKCGYFYICENIFEDNSDCNGNYAKLGYMLENHPYFEIVGNISDNAPERLKGGEL